MADPIFPAASGRRPGLALFLNAGDPSFAVLRELVLMLDEREVDCLELAVPFPNVVTDGPVIRRSAARAIAGGADLDSTLAFVAEVRPRLAHLRLVLMADWRHTVRALAMDGFLGRARDAGCDGLLLHGVPPRARPGYYESARGAGLPIVTTCFVGSPEAAFGEAALHASAYLYLVSHFGKGEGAGGPDPAKLAPAIGALRERTAAPIAVGFGVRTGADVEAVAEAGADAAIVGSSCVACLETALGAGADPVPAMRRFVDELRQPLAVF
jgi:tryptophan synthase alpha chain